MKKLKLKMRRDTKSERGKPLEKEEKADNDMGRCTRYYRN